MSTPGWSTNRQPRRSSISTPPLRLPGQSVDERMSALQAQIADLLIPPLCSVVLAVYGWVQWWAARPLHPVIFTTMAIITILYAWKKILPVRSSIKQLRLGRGGERLVGQMLEHLRQKGYRVFHDIPGPGFNIDHAIVGAAGIFTIETKTRTKPARGRSKIFYDGTTLRMEGKAPFDEPLNQVRAQARWLANLLNDGRTTGLKVRPILVFPDWYVERTGHRGKDDVWVLNPKALDKFLDHEPPLLSSSSVESAAQALTQYCRYSLEHTAPA